MRTASNNLKTHLQTTKQFVMADLFTLTLIDGTIMRHTSYGSNVSYGGNDYDAKTLLLKRGSIALVVGLQVDRLEIEAIPVNANIGNQGFLAAIKNGALDGANFQLSRIFLDANNNAIGDIALFTGKVSDIDFARSGATIQVASILELLNVNWPLHVYMPSCLWTVYGAGCNANKTSFTVTGKANDSSNTTMIYSANLSAYGNNYFDQGVISFTSGNAMGARRTVKNHMQGNATGIIELIFPLPANPGTNANFSIYPGCDKDFNSCNNKFSNTNRRRAYPFIPTPETGI